MKKIGWVWVLFICIGGFAQENPHQFVAFDCGVCHSTASWKDVQFNHQLVNYPLIGSHRTLDCLECHDIKDFRMNGNDCSVCHVDVHQEKLGRECQRCHTPETWRVLDVTVAHENTTFPLMGAHARLECQVCHRTEIQGEFALLTSDCVSCHRVDYDGAQNPQHATMGFPIRCEDCHNMTAWRPANFSGHDNYFPIYSGAHGGKWDTCMDCHTSPGSFQVFSCFEGCHEHNKNRMDDKHREVSGYVYESNACYSCHPSGGE